MMDEVYPGRNPDIRYWVNFISDLLRDCKEYFLYVAEEEGKIIGFTDFLIQYDPTFSCMVLNSFQTYVLPKYRNTGATRGLWKNLVTSAKSNNCPKIFFSTAPHLFEYWTGVFGADLREINMTIETDSLKEV